MTAAAAAVICQACQRRHARPLALADGQRVHPRAPADGAEERLALRRVVRVVSGFQGWFFVSPFPRGNSTTW